MHLAATFVHGRFDLEVLVLEQACVWATPSGGTSEEFRSASKHSTSKSNSLYASMQARTTHCARSASNKRAHLRSARQFPRCAACWGTPETVHPSARGRSGGLLWPSPAPVHDPALPAGRSSCTHNACPDKVKPCLSRPTFFLKLGAVRNSTSFLSGANLGKEGF